MHIEKDKFDLVYDFIGHSEFINKNYYQAPPGAQQLSYVQPILEDVQKKIVQAYKKKNSKDNGNVKESRGILFICIFQS